jgi:ribosome assembly protein SQT1
MFTVPSGRNMGVFSGHTASVTCGKFLLDGKRLITGSEDGSLIIWDPKNITPEYKLSPTDGRFKLEGGITCLACNGTGTAAIIGGADGGLRIINLTNGQLIQSLEGHGSSDEENEIENSTEAVAWSPGTQGSKGLWVSVGTDKKVKVFEASNGSLRWTGEHEVGVSFYIFFSPQYPI